MNTEFNEYPNGTPQEIEVPAPTAWPIIVASGLTRSSREW
jgi:hypothetical protein